METYHQNVGKIDEHNRITFLSSTGDVETHRGHGLGPAALDEVQSHGELEDLTCSLRRTLGDVQGARELLDVSITWTTLESNFA